MDEKLLKSTESSKAKSNLKYGITRSDQCENVSMQSASKNIPV